MRLFPLILSLLFFLSCKKERTPSAEQPGNSAGMNNASVPVRTLTGPLNEIKMYRLFPGLSATDKFEASGVYATENYFYVVCDNFYKIVKIFNTLPEASNANSFTGSNISGSSNYEGITYNSFDSSFYVLTEAAQNGSSYYPEITSYSNSFSNLSCLWSNYAFPSSTSNKAFEGIAWVRRNNNDYMLCVVESTGKIAVMQLAGNTWIMQTEFTIPVSFTDYSEIAIYGNKIAILSQQDSRFWLGTLSDISWEIINGSGIIYKFPTGNSSGIAGGGSDNIYAFEEGLSFINDSTIVTCSDQSAGSDPAYKKYKEQSIQLFRLR